LILAKVLLEKPGFLVFLLPSNPCYNNPKSSKRKTVDETPKNGSKESSGKRCEYVREFLSGDPKNPCKICAYKCKGYAALATFPWPKDKPCPPSFDGNFPGP